MVFTTEIPTLPPTLRNRLYKPLALPIISLRSVPMEVVARGTKTNPEHEPLRMMGISSDHCDISNDRWLIQMAVPAKPRKPVEMSQRWSSLLVRKATTGIMQMAPMPRGLTASPAERAEYPM